MVFWSMRSNKGSTLIIFALSLTVLLGFTAIVVDFGRVLLEKTKLQNALDASVLAAAQDLPDTSSAYSTANDYAQKNGLLPSEISIAFSDENRVITVTASKKVNYTFAKVLGYDSIELTPGASAECGTIGDCFDYVLFSGSRNTTLTLNGSNQLIEGSSHTNKNFTANGSRLTITGACEAVTTVTVNGSHIDINNRAPGSPFVEMPDFSETIRLQAEKAGQIYNGNKNFNGSALVIDEPMYVNGNVTVNGSKFRGKGCILATGNITFNGSNLNESTDDAVCFYSKNGDITINGSNSEFDGILYAPDGSITMNGSNQTVNGRVIGNTVIINGSNLKIIGGSEELRSLPSKAAKLIK